MGELLLGIDIGTSSSKGVLARPDGKVLATSLQTHELSLPRPGWAEHDAGKVWWTDFKAICAELLPKTDGSLAAICEVMNETTGSGKRLVAVGGGTKGGLWMQIVSDVTGRPQELPQETIGASYGDALSAGIATGLVKPSQAWNTPIALIEPNVKAHEVYADFYDVFRKLYPAIRTQLHDLADLQERDLV